MLTTLIILASITFVSMMSPGPDMMLLIKYGSSKKRWPAVACITGICCGLAVHVSLSILGVAAIIATSATIYSTVKLIGAAYLIYIGFQAIRSVGGASLSGVANLKTEGQGSPFCDGLLCNVLNPKVTLFILAVFTQIVEPATPITEKVLYGLFITLEAFIVWNVFVSLVRTKLILSFLQRYEVAINRIAGVVLIAFGGSIALED